jgi:hypothetical protein
MPWLFAGLAQLLTTFFAFFRSLTLRLPVLLAYTALILAVTTAYLSTAQSSIEALHQSIPSIVLDVWGWFMPGNTIPCFLALITGKLYSWSYNTYYEYIRAKAFLLRP